MKQYLTHPIFNLIGQEADRMQLSCYVVGGFVRDLMLKRSSKDVDIVVLGDGIDLAHAVASKLKGNPKVNFFKNFGTAMIKSDDWEIEFVGARKESYAHHSRKPVVKPGTLEDDQNRRDFTINAMAISLNAGSFGTLIDPFNGVQHLEEKHIVTPLAPDITFSDDPLRMMRAIRFATQLDFTMAPETLESITRNAERIKIVSMERVTDELNKIILSPLPSIGFKHLFNTGLLQLIFPELANMQGIKVINGKAHKDNFYHTIQVLDNIATETDDLWLRWAAILHDIAKPATQRFVPGEGWTFHGHEDRGARMVSGIFRRLKLPMNEKMKLVEKLVLLHLRPKSLAESEVTDSAMRRLLFEAGDDMDGLFILCRADITSKNAEKVARYKKNLAEVEEKIKEVESRDRIRNWQPPVTGEDIMKSFDIGPCKEVGLIKNAIRDAILDGDIPNSRTEALALMKEVGEQNGLLIKTELN
ncbi:MAG: HD domain-containing protein [Bacteroidia bacterium]|nr:HD domain-containing protein [Bacteroidia bacterium]MBP9724597.1 HD domain-containing protein [Bacteroidia bacterium]